MNYEERDGQDLSEYGRLKAENAALKERVLALEIEVKFFKEETCKCGHTRAAHSGHCHILGTPDPDHCAVPCLANCMHFDPAIEPIARREAQLKARDGIACGACGLPVLFEFTVESQQWNRIVRAKGVPEYLCFWCFDDFAAQDGETVAVGVNINGKAATSRWCCDDVPGAYPGDITKTQLSAQLKVAVEALTSCAYEYKSWQLDAPSLIRGTAQNALAEIQKLGSGAILPLQDTVNQIFARALDLVKKAVNHPGPGGEK